MRHANGAGARRPPGRRWGRRRDARPAGSIDVSYERQQAIGVRLGLAEKVSGRRTLRTTGRVSPNENAVYPLVAGSEGWVQELRGATTGSLVRKGEVLLSIYSVDFVVAQQSYYSGLDTLGRVSSEQTRTTQPGRVVESVERFANTLRNLGVSDDQLAEMREKRQLHQYIRVVAPVNGFVLDRSASVGLRFDRGFQFFRIADLSRVWVLADLYESQAAFVKRGAPARITVPQQSRQFTATVSATEPVFDEATRTLKVRLETDNPGFALKPGMFADVEFEVELPPTLAVPADAIVDTGLRKTLFVERGNGYFEPRQVTTGWRIGDQVEIVKGLMPGERIVISGTFLMDSESRMKAAASGVFGAAAKDPVCGMEVDEKKASATGRTSQHAGTTYYFCADDCKKRFDAEPAKFTQGTGHGAIAGTASPTTHEHGTVPAAVRHADKPTPAARAGAMESMKAPVPAMAHAEHASAGMTPDAAASATEKDPVCGMDVDPKEAKAAGRLSTHAGNDVLLLRRQLQAPIRRRAGEVPEEVARRALRGPHRSGAHDRTRHRLLGQEPVPRPAADRGGGRRRLVCRPPSARSTRSRTSATPRSSSTRSGTAAPTSSRPKSPIPSSPPCSARPRCVPSAVSPTSATRSSTSSSRTTPTSTGPARARSSTSPACCRACPRTRRQSSAPMPPASAGSSSTRSWTRAGNAALPTSAPTRTGTSATT